jgi:hypothetical protein
LKGNDGNWQRQVKRGIWQNEEGGRRRKMREAEEGRRKEEEGEGE